MTAWVLRLTGEDGPKGLVRYTPTARPCPETAPGDILEGTVTLRYAGTRHEEATEFHLSDGVTLLAYPEEGLSRAGRWEHAWVYFPKVLAARLAGTVAALWPEDAAPLVQGILLGGARGPGRGHCRHGRPGRLRHLPRGLRIRLPCERAGRHAGAAGPGRAAAGPCWACPLVGLFTLLTGAEAPVLRRRLHAGGAAAGAPGPAGGGQPHLPGGRPLRCSWRTTPTPWRM